MLRFAYVLATLKLDFSTVAQAAAATTAVVTAVVTVLLLTWLLVEMAAFCLCFDEFESCENPVFDLQKCYFQSLEQS